MGAPVDAKGGVADVEFAEGYFTSVLGFIVESLGVE